MTAYIARKPCRFGGTDYRVGDSIPAEKIDPRKAHFLVSIGYVAPAIAAATIKQSEEKTTQKKTLSKKTTRK